MKISLNSFTPNPQSKESTGSQAGYGINTHVIPLVFGHIISGGVYGQRHLALANLKTDNDSFVHTFSERILHKTIGLIEHVPVIGTLAAALEGVAQKVFSKKQQASHLTHTNVMDIINNPPKEEFDPAKHKFIMKSPIVKDNPISKDKKEDTRVNLCLTKLGFTPDGQCDYSFTPLYSDTPQKFLRLEKGQEEGLYDLYEIKPSDKSFKDKLCTITIAETSSEITLTKSGIDKVMKDRN